MGYWASCNYIQSASFLHIRHGELQLQCMRPNFLIFLCARFLFPMCPSLYPVCLSPPCWDTIWPSQLSQSTGSRGREGGIERKKTIRQHYNMTPLGTTQTAAFCGHEGCTFKKEDVLGGFLMSTWHTPESPRRRDVPLWSLLPLSWDPSPAVQEKSLIRTKV